MLTMSPPYSPLPKIELSNNPLTVRPSTWIGVLKVVTVYLCILAALTGGIVLLAMVLVKGNVSNYGEECSGKSEKIRQDYMREYRDSSSYTIPAARKPDVFPSGMRRCHMDKLLICDQITEKCVCGFPLAAPANYKYKPNSSLYIVDDDGNCRWNLGSFCFPTGPYDRSYDFNYDFRRGAVHHHDPYYKCVNGTTCKTLEGTTCSVNGAAYFLAEKDKVMNEKNLMEEIMAGKVCTCQAD